MRISWIHIRFLYARRDICGLEHLRNLTTRQRTVKQFRDEWSNGVDYGIRRVSGPGNRQPRFVSSHQLSLSGVQAAILTAAVPTATVPTTAIPFKSTGAQVGLVHIFGQAG